MKFYLLLLICSIFSVSSFGQPVATFWKGEREVVKIDDPENKVLLMHKSAALCGEYFIYRNIKDQRILSFQINLTKEDKRVVSYRHVDLSILRIILDDKKYIPTAEYSSANKKDNKSKVKYVIRISKTDLSGADCLSEIPIGK